MNNLTVESFERLKGELSEGSNFLFLDSNTYVFKNNFDYTFIVEDKENLLNDEIIEKLKAKDFTIYHNDLDCYYWIFDFKVNGVWFEATSINLVEHKIHLNAFK